MKENKNKEKSSTPASKFSGNFSAGVNEGRKPRGISDSAKADPWGIRDGQQDTSHIPVE